MLEADDELVRKYGWVATVEAWTVAVVKGRTVEEVVRLYGGEPAVPVGELTFAGVDGIRVDTGFHLQVVRRGDVVVAIENDGYSGAFPEIVRRGSGGGEFFSVYWNIHAAGMVTQAIGGVVTARFESLFPVEPEPRAADVRPDWAVGPRVEPALAFPVCMALLEQQAGVAVEHRWLLEPQVTYQIPDPYELYAGVEGADRV